jgi:hypothetical protein
MFFSEFLFSNLKHKLLKYVTITNQEKVKQYGFIQCFKHLFTPKKVRFLQTGSGPGPYVQIRRNRISNTTLLKNNSLLKATMIHDY